MTRLRVHGVLGIHAAMLTTLCLSCGVAKPRFLALALDAVLCLLSQSFCDIAQLLKVWRPVFCGKVCSVLIGVLCLEVFVGYA